MRLIRRLIGNARGQALVELALVLPILILLVMGAIEFGRVFNSYLLITNASREGARAGITGEYDTEIRTRVKTVADSLSLTDSDITITPEQSFRTRGVPLTVEVNHSVNLVTPLFGTIIPDPFPLSSSTTMRME
ncbi:MAG: pilus assembly protein [Firmicutes bacterium]|nr:pilus assembly protein [Bacillota bacterium]